MQEEGDFVEQAFGRTGTLDDDRARILHQVRLFLAAQVAARVDDDGRERAQLFMLHAFEQFVTLDVGQLQVDDHAVENLRFEQFQRLLAQRHGRDFHVVVADQVHHAFALAFVVLDQQDAFRLLREFRLEIA
ncbi:hypothetical protein D3C72_1566310 [compost metagenome]